MKALVIGATGIIGNHVVRALLDEGVEVRTFSRGVTSALNLERLDVERFRGDLGHPDSLSKAIRGCSWVFHTAAYYPTSTFDQKGHLKRAMEGIQSVLQAVSHYPIDRLVYTSSLTTIGRPKKLGQIADEACEYDLTHQPIHPYFKVKHFMEQEVLKRSQKDIPAVVVNPTGCFGPFELKPPQLCLIPLLVSKKIPAYVQRPMNVVDAADVGRGHVLAAQKGRIGERYILGGHNVTTQWIIQQICRIADVSPPRFKVPLELALIPSYLSELVAYTILRRPPLLPILGLRFLQYGQHLSIAKAQNELDYKVSSMEPCFEKAIGWFRKIGYC